MRPHVGYLSGGWGEALRNLEDWTGMSPIVLEKRITGAGSDFRHPPLGHRPRDAGSRATQMIALAERDPE